MDRTSFKLIYAEKEYEAVLKRQEYLEKRKLELEKEIKEMKDAGYKSSSS